jgi:hypothetical protein
MSHMRERTVRIPIAARVTRLPPLIGYAVAIVTTAAAVLLRLGLEPLWDYKLPLLTFFPAILSLYPS